MKPAFKLPSPETGTEYWIYIAAPDAAREPGPWPVVLFMDGDDQFRFAVQAYRALRRARAVPPLLLVGVGYGASYGRAENKRVRDYTATPDPDEPAGGGAEAFLKFLTHTLWPELAWRYPLDEKRRGIAGYSLSALLVLIALFRKRPFFTHHLAAAPSIWWGRRHVLAQVKRLRSRQASLPAQLFLGVGEKDSESMIGDLALLEAQLTAKPFAGLHLASRQFAGRTHYNALPVSFRTGLRVLFGRQPVSDL